VIVGIHVDVAIHVDVLVYVDVSVYVGILIVVSVDAGVGGAAHVAIVVPSTISLRGEISAQDQGADDEKNKE
jgi:hypothetical protein